MLYMYESKSYMLDKPLIWHLHWIISLIRLIKFLQMDNDRELMMVKVD